MYKRRVLRGRAMHRTDGQAPTGIPSRPMAAMADKARHAFAAPNPGRAIGMVRGGGVSLCVPYGQGVCINGGIGGEIRHHSG